MDNAAFSNNRKCLLLIECRASRSLSNSPLSTAPRRKMWLFRRIITLLYASKRSGAGHLWSAFFKVETIIFKLYRFAISVQQCKNSDVGF